MTLKTKVIYLILALLALVGLLGVIYFFREQITARVAVSFLNNGVVSLLTPAIF